MTFKRLFVSLFAALALLASIVCVMFFGAPKTTASAAADDARALNKKTFVLKHGDTDGFYPVTSEKWYKFVGTVPGSIALYNGDMQIGTWTYGAPSCIKDSSGNKLGTWVEPESGSGSYFKITGETYKLKVPESDKYKDYFYEEVTDTTIPDVSEVEKLSFELIPAPQEGYTVDTNKWYKFKSVVKLSNMQIYKNGEEVGRFNLDVPHSGFKKDGVHVGGIYLYGGTDNTIVFIKFDDAYQLVIAADSYATGSDPTAGVYEEAGKEEPENPGESGSTENPGESDKSSETEQPGNTEKPDKSDNGSDSESSERFVDAASKWLKDNLAVNVSAGVVGGIIVIGLIVLVFKRK